MARVVVAETARADLGRMILTHSLPASTPERVRASLEPLATFPMLGAQLQGRWERFRFVLGPWPWMLLIYVWDEQTDVVAVVTIHDARSATSATGGTREPA